jgi:ATP-dependent protease ClpP protease subunit
VSLDTENTFVLRGQIDIVVVQQAIITLNNPKIKYMVLDTPGGSIYAAKILGEFLETRQDITCITKFAASMGFYILQVCGKRYAGENSVFLQHQQQFAKELTPINTFLSHLKAELYAFRDSIDKVQAKRIGISLKKFRRLISDDWLILSGTQAKELNVIDEVVTVLCSDAMMKTQPPTCPYLL